VVKIKIRENDFGDYDILEIEEREKIIEEIVKHYVHQALAEEILTAWLDRLEGDATAVQLELLDRHPEAVKFLDSITVIED
jgi:hypothetical protein